MMFSTGRPVTVDDVVDALVSALGKVAPPSVSLDRGTVLVDAGIDSLGLLGALLELELSTQVRISETVVRNLTIELGEGVSTVGELAQAIVRELEREESC
jgi:acyl carrier protein